MKKALVTGAAGQDGSYMCDLLISKGYEVHGIVRPSGNRSFWQLNNVTNHPRFSILWHDITEPGLFYELSRYDYDEVYHFAAVSHVKTSFEDPAFTLQVNGVATAHLFNAFYKFSPGTRIYNAGSSEMFANQDGGLPTELEACSPYAVGKISAHLLSKIYRSREMFIVSGIAYNHESSRRGENFVTRKIGLSLAETGQVTLGNIYVKRDWHHAKDFVQGAYLSMQQKYPDEWVFASGEARTVKEFAEEACKLFNLDPEKAILTHSKNMRPNEVGYLRGDPRQTEIGLGWKRKYTFKQIVEDCCASVEKRSSLRL